ncbi:MAG: transposase [Burkholderiales bacterium]|nr:transposase [Burkholderiales bacterium]
MPNYVRAVTPGATYFFTVALGDRRASWLVEHVDLLRESVMVVKRRHPFGIDAMVVMPDHLHALWTMPAGDAAYAMRWMLIKQRFAKLLRRRIAIGRQRSYGNGEVDIWQRRFWEHQVRDDGDYARHVDYIHFNPVKHGYVTRASEWPHSSFHRWVREGRLPADWGVAAGVVDGGFGE